MFIPSTNYFLANSNLPSHRITAIWYETIASLQLRFNLYKALNLFLTNPLRHLMQFPHAWPKLFQLFFRYLIFPVIFCANISIIQQIKQFRFFFGLSWPGAMPTRIILKPNLKSASIRIICGYYSSPSAFFFFLPPHGASCLVSSVPIFQPDPSNPSHPCHPCSILFLPGAYCLLLQSFPSQHSPSNL